MGGGAHLLARSDELQNGTLQLLDQRPSGHRCSVIRESVSWVEMAVIALRGFKDNRGAGSHFAKVNSSAIPAEMRAVLFRDRAQNRRIRRGLGVGPRLTARTACGACRACAAARQFVERLPLNQEPGPEAKRCRCVLDAGSQSLRPWNNHRAAAVIRYRGLAANHDRVRCARVDKDVGERRLETIQVVGDERGVAGTSSIDKKHA